MVSKAISGVKRPVLLDTEREPAAGPNKDEERKAEVGRRNGQREKC